jgi:hypothetical protein
MQQFSLMRLTAHWQGSSMAAMLSRKHCILTLFLVLIGACIVSACGNDCKDLANKICDCQPTLAQQQRCQNAVDAANSNANLSDKQQDCCKAILDADTCTCSRLEAGDFAACGLTNETSLFPQCPK